MKLLEMNHIKTGRAFLMLASDERWQYPQYYTHCLDDSNGTLFLQALLQVPSKHGDQTQLTVYCQTSADQLEGIVWFKR